ncbi:oligoendopeptidase F [Thermosipho melanesiensis]|uniref:Oligoendopeptidase, M3 family n=2 Tax=Thermosipho melanesiensis TaxID=46541 RepID=A6LJC2_THEM4|nr:M3 family oligoendopeptidase [Thermosipho melanesiensis]ABR30023.1 oligoendopeptidase, M3 family [Thermosipho melanesiensis BI429]APT73224.1 oligoendopeptidase F [Thermosipho melanesiensis]OOC38617.1 oligoendopeptidase F [Thermosipho melanesiensis]OOC40421.1 oligoendopeptidase F [Thermosipho melanesiensis]OOC40686.1 oligoendopeptidase F [Thermosipho melanesiensis]
MIFTNKKIEKRERKYFKDLSSTDAEKIIEVLNSLLEKQITKEEDVVELVEKLTELSDIVAEEMGWRYINMTRFADKKEYAEKFNEYFQNVVSELKPYYIKLEKKIYDSDVKISKEYVHMLNIISNNIELFREENIPLQVEERKLSNKYGAIFGSIEVEFRGEKKTLQQLLPYLKSPDREIREEAWRKRFHGLLEKREELDKLFDELKEIRIKQARNAGFDNYRDYMHKLKGRFEYTVDDVYKFHEAVEKKVMPFFKKRMEKRAKKLGLEVLKPWDTAVDVDGKVLNPYQTVDEFVDKAIKILGKVKPLFGERLEMMKNSGLLDLENRKGKAPGGYNYPLPETGAPFIFMNATGQSGDVRTLLHESGHAMHTFETVNIPITYYRPNRMEIAELASMSMELLTMHYWSEYYKDEEEYKKAMIEELEHAVLFLPWCMTVDAFQQWIYTNDHTPEERAQYFGKLMDKFNQGVDWSGLELEKQYRWLFQLHIFEVPFYYIEYGIAQLGALSIYKNYIENPEKTIENYHNFLKVGYKVPIDKVYEVAGIKLDFSEEHIEEIVNFVEERLRLLEGE